MSTTMQIQIPAGTAPNAILQVRAPDGRTIKVRVPPNVRPGQQMRISVPAAAAPKAPPQPPRPPPRPPGSTLMRVKIPPHVPAGGSITVRAPDGKLVRVRVPPGVAPGATITVRI
mmetsp:Transcript_10400/g.30745  ORF Transcript_10400/g.30745 Transcript_10400/m.30745 type:complete len:115 (+) Transcript_10400:83-427(+)